MLIIFTVKAMNGTLYLMLGKAVQRIERLKYLIQSIIAVVLANKLSSQCYILTNVLIFVYQFGVVFYTKLFAYLFIENIFQELIINTGEMPFFFFKQMKVKSICLDSW